MKAIKKRYVVISIIVFWILSTSLFADPINNIIRLSYVNGNVNLQPAEEKQWVNAAINRPLVLGDCKIGGQ